MIRNNSLFERKSPAYPLTSLQLVTTVLLAMTVFVVAGCEQQAATSTPETTKLPETTKVPQRHVWVTGLDPAKVEHYESLHADPWPGVTRKIQECNIENMSIHKREIEGKLYLFLYLEYVGDDFDADMAKMAADPETQRWWKETDPCQIPLPDAAAKGEIWSETEEVYYQE